MGGLSLEMVKKYTLELEKEEMEIALTQLGARIDSLIILQKKEAKLQNISRVIELEEYLNIMRSIQEKMQESMFSN